MSRQSKEKSRVRGNGGAEYMSPAGNTTHEAGNGEKRIVEVPADQRFLLSDPRRMKAVEVPLRWLEPSGDKAKQDLTCPREQGPGEVKCRNLRGQQGGRDSTDAGRVRDKRRGRKERWSTPQKGSLPWLVQRLVAPKPVAVATKLPRLLVRRLRILRSPNLKSRRKPSRARGKPLASSRGRNILEEHSSTLDTVALWWFSAPSIYTPAQALEAMESFLEPKLLASSGGRGTVIVRGWCAGILGSPYHENDPQLRNTQYRTVNPRGARAAARARHGHGRGIDGLATMTQPNVEDDPSSVPKGISELRRSQICPKIFHYKWSAHPTAPHFLFFQLPGENINLDNPGSLQRKFVQWLFLLAGSTTSILLRNVVRIKSLCLFVESETAAACQLLEARIQRSIQHLQFSERLLALQIQQEYLSLANTVNGLVGHWDSQPVNRQRSGALGFVVYFLNSSRAFHLAKLRCRIVL
ncbi:hypothetical protein DFH06DRAFT_1396584 [Mycena polygramma]|nr:hypothetical protein DFH06DRAFT_1396584 [Mycena polygramma]